MAFISESADRVPIHTSHNVNKQIEHDTVRRLEKIGWDKDRISSRLCELDQEWDIERAIEANASTVALIGLALGASINKKWFVLPAVVATFLLQHAVQGWCPPVPVLRRLGFRTSREIENERAILLARRGDFERIKNVSASEATALLN
ncbi:MAG: hypothetical protein K0R29_2815 [Pseudobdellovibrio sp.]|jgi:hypothetical protein|nr:hypothetical protein [Pseudobdellovibrio sp.]